MGNFVAVAVILVFLMGMQIVTLNSVQFRIFLKLGLIFYFSSGFYIGFPDSEAQKCYSFSWFGSVSGLLQQIAK